MADINVFPVAEGAIMQVSVNKVRLLIELSPVDIAVITASLVAAMHGSMRRHDTIDALKDSLPAPAHRISGNT
jgi:hypothetical protein